MGFPCHPLGDIPDPGIEPASLMSTALAGRFFTTGATWEAHLIIIVYIWGFPDGSDGKESACDARDLGSQTSTAHSVYMSMPTLPICPALSFPYY